MATLNSSFYEIQQILNKLKDYLNGENIKSLEQMIHGFNIELKSMNDFQNVSKLNKKFDLMLDGLIADASTFVNEKKSNQKSEVERVEKNCLPQLFDLEHMVRYVVYSKMLDFMREISIKRDKIDIFYNNILKTEEEINKRYHKLVLYFHSDKIVSSAPNELKDEFKNFCDEIFRYVTDMRRKLLSDLKESSKNSFTEFHEKNANDLWAIAMDYRNAHKAEWGKLKVFKINDLRNISTEDLKRESNSKARAAYKEYRAACKIADSKKLISHQIKFRRFMALCLYISDQYHEAQLYALSAINLVYRNSNNPLAKQELNEAKRIFDKVKGGNVSDLKNPNQQSTDRTVSLSSDPYALVAIDRDLSYFEMKNLNHSINEDLEKITNELMLKADRKLVQLNSNREEILKAERHARFHLAAAGFVQVSMVAVGKNVAENSRHVIMTDVEEFITGVGVICLGLYIGNNLWSKGTELMQEPVIRKTLNEIMRKALIAYDNGDYNKFLEELSEEYRNGKKILTIRENGEVNAERIIEDLLKHNFRSDGIAYLLNLLGEVLISGKVTIQGMTNDDLKSQGSTAFKGVMSKKLEDEARELDESIEVYRKSKYRNIKLFMKGYAREFENEKQSRPFFYRLEEIRNLTRINLAMQYILNGKPDAIKQAKVIIQQVRESLMAQSSSIAKKRLKVVDDFLWVISGDTSITEIPYLM